MEGKGPTFPGPVFINIDSLKKKLPSGQAEKRFLAPIQYYYVAVEPHVSWHNFQTHTDILMFNLYNNLLICTVYQCLKNNGMAQMLSKRNKIATALTWMI